jgi:membrane protein
LGNPERPSLGARRRRGVLFAGRVLSGDRGGSVSAALGWLAVSSLFSWYLGNFANYNATYGALGAVVGLMMWLWFSTIVVLVGAELNSEIEHQTARDSTVGLEKPLGTRGAVMADTVGPAVT